MFKRGRTFWTVVKVQGKWKNISLRTDDRVRARQVEAELKLLLRAGDGKTVAGNVDIVVKRLSPSVTLEEAFVRFMTERPHRVGASQFTRDKASINKLRPFFGSERLDDVTREMIHEYKMARYEDGVSGATINREVDCLSALYTMAIRDWATSKENPCHSLRREPEGGRDRVLSDEEECLLLDTSDEMKMTGLRDLIIHALDSGMRENAIFGLVRQDVDLFGRRIRVRAETNKGGVTQVIPITDRLYEQLKRILASPSESAFVYPNRVGGKQDGSGWFGKKWRTLCAKAGIKDIWFHDLRRTFATRLYEGGTDIEKIAQLLGHSSVATTARYIKRKFNFLDGTLEPLNRRNLARADDRKKKGQPGGF